MFLLQPLHLCWMVCVTRIMMLTIWTNIICNIGIDNVGQYSLIDNRSEVSERNPYHIFWTYTSIYILNVSAGCVSRKRPGNVLHNLYFNTRKAKRSFWRLFYKRYLTLTEKVRWLFILSDTHESQIQWIKTSGFVTCSTPIPTTMHILFFLSSR